jgi:dTDP-4-dehydrorhamnose reductase
MGGFSIVKVLVTGSEGQLGQQLIDVLGQNHTVTGYDVDDMDIADLDQTMRVIQADSPDVIIHGAALTNVDYCAENPDYALWINGYGTQHVAYAAQAVDATLLYVSTNEVFDGTETTFYREHDRPNPINPYGYSKWIGEQEVQRLTSKHFIVRVSWLFGHGGRNFIHTIRRLADEGRDLRVVVNEVATPTYVDDFVAVLAQLIETPYYGIYHLVNEGRASRWDFARHILDCTGYADKPLAKISAAEYPRPSTPPEYAVLRNFIGAKRGMQLRDWREAVAAFIDKEDASED